MKTKETSTKVNCNLCGEPKEGVQTGICSNCGRFGKTNRELALAWWNSLSDGFEFGSKFKKLHKFLDNHKMVGFSSKEGRTIDSLTGSEIELIWKENGLPNPIEKPNLIGNTPIGRMIDEEIHPEKYNKVYSQEEVDRLLDQQTARTTAQMLNNQKQFKEFNESLFLAYIRKFSDDDKIRGFDAYIKVMLQSGFSKGQIKQAIEYH